MTTPQDKAARAIEWKTASATAAAGGNAWRAVLYVLLILSAFAALFGYEEIQVRVMARALAPEWRLAPAAFFSVALVAYAVDRILLVRAGRFPPGKAFFQVALGLALLTFLLPGGLRDYQVGRVQATAPDDVVALMKHTDPRVRALAAELAGHRDRDAYLPELVGALRDDDARVREAAHASLKRRTGQDHGPGPDSYDAWMKSLSTTPGSGAAAP